MRNLARLLTSQGPINWEIARQMAQWAATGGEPERNPDPVARVRIEELLRVAEMHVAEATGLPVSSGGLLTVRSVTPAEWALRTLDDWKPLLEKLASTMTAVAALGPRSSGRAGGPGMAAGRPDGPTGARRAAAAAFDPMAQLFGNLPQVLGPFLFGMQAGSMVGQLGLPGHGPVRPADAPPAAGTS